jgi:signal transduction histidine kinase
MLPYLKNYPVLFNMGIVCILVIFLILGYFVNDKTDDLYIGRYHLKKKSSEMEKMNRELISLYKSMAARTEELTRANNQLRKLDQMKSDFISIVSHEFRSPLTSIKAFSKILLNNKENVAPEESADFLRIIDQECDRLTRMINDMLDLSKLDADKMEWDMQEVVLDRVISNALESIYPLSKAKDIQIVTHLDDTLPAIIGDSDRLIQVITNLFNNAVKFTPEKGTIKIYTEQIGSEVRVTVEDNGIGIPEDQLQDIFSKFRQGGDIVTDKPQGTGLGLPICKSILHAHKGKIWVESIQGNGSRFCITLPVARKEDAQERTDSLVNVTNVS